MPLNFGIPSLDKLLEIPNVKSKATFEATSMAILGPDGSGKSVLALHLASTYIAECIRYLEHPHFKPKVPVTDAAGKLTLPRIIYISSDLRFESAKKVWRNFDLSHPTNRQIPFEQIWESMDRLGLTRIPEALRTPGVKLNPLNVVLTCFLPGSISSKAANSTEIGSYLAPQPAEDPNKPTATLGFAVGTGYLAPRPPKDRNSVEVAFLDLATHTAGDDWSFANSLIGQLGSIEAPRLKEGEEGELRDLKHLVIIDSVAGFETFVGKLDAHGEEQTRRARIAQCMRNAGEHCHVVFVVEEPKDDERLPEEYVTDVVVRLRTSERGSRVERTVEVEKARARQHATGEHPFEIRGDQGTSTGEWENPDCPSTKNSYVQIFPTIAHRYAIAAMEFGPGKGEPSPLVAPFGLRYLDQLLGRGLRMDELDLNKRKEGLRCGSLAAILGDSGTGKSVLTEKLLAEGFRGVAMDWITLFVSATGRATRDVPTSGQSAWDRTVSKLFSSVVIRHGEPLEDFVGPYEPTLTVLICAALVGEMRSESVLKERCEDGRRKALTGHSESEDLVEGWVDLFTNRENRVRVVQEHRFQRNQPDRPRALHGLPHLTLLSAELNAWSSKKWGTLEAADAVKLLRLVFSHPNFRFPGILLTTSDKKAKDVAGRCLDYLDDNISKVLADLGVTDPSFRGEVKEHLQTIVEEQLIVRRLDIDNLSAAAIAHLIHKNIHAAQELIFGAYVPPSQQDRNPKSNRIQLVIDDFRVLSNMCPALQDESLFLPYLNFMLEREGVTSVVVYTDAVRPDRRPEDETSRTLLSLVNLGIFLWSVPFEGRSRVALAVVPPRSDATNGIVRELTMTDYPGYAGKGHRVSIPRVTPRFELYSGIEEGHPRLVPLAVYLFDEASRFKEYVDTEDMLYRELFASYSDGDLEAKGRILFPLSSKRYDALRDFAHLPSDTQDGHTIVYQVDGYWSMGSQGSLNSVYRYLFEKFATDPQLAKHQDPYALFRGSPQSGTGNEGRAKRVQFFANKYYRSRLIDFGTPGDDTKGRLHSDEFVKPDRVPFMWDFAFMLARTGPWSLARDKDLECELHGTEPTRIKVGEVFKRLTSLNSGGGKPEVFEKYGWRYFFEACQTVAAEYRMKTGTPVTAFDIATPSGETINCLVLEIWLSELASEGEGLPLFGAKNCEGKKWPELLEIIALSKYDPNRHFSLESLIRLGMKEGATVRSAFESLQTRPPSSEVAIGALTLYKTWLLLIEVLDLSQFCDPTDNFNLIDSRSSSTSAVASRHWYKTACDISAKIQGETGVHDGVSLLRLPGSFSTRGDWFLASSQGSRSRLLAEYAIDLLSSRRANLTRMQMGLGLPVRDIIDDRGADRLRTALQCEISDKLTDVLYKDLVERCGIVPGLEQDTPNFHWLWRTAFTDYDRQSRVLQKWLARVFKWSIGLRQKYGKAWEGGFLAYDEISQREFVAFSRYPSSLEFADHCDLLLDELLAAKRTEPDR
jgi:KaiC/GvpD/RAD55 family RecA-like ATPase